MYLRKLVAALAAVAVGSSAQAAFVVGTQSFAFPGDKTLNSPDINTSSTFNLDTPVIAGESRTGDFLARFGSQLVQINNSSLLNLANVTTFVVGDSFFGTFTAAVLVEDNNTSQFSRALTFSGVYDPGTAFPAGQQDNSPALFTLSLTQTGGAGTAVSASGSLTTSAGTTPPAVPAPPTAFALLSALPALAVLRRIRRAAA